jgi:CCR4-NOT transcription complex subunit 1
MRLPDPFTRDLKIDLLPETFKQPEIHSDYMHNLRKNPEFLKQLDAMLKSNTSPFSSREGGNAFIQNFLLKDEEVYSYGSHYNIPLINSFVLYVGIFAIEQKQGTVSKNDGRIMELYKQIVMALDSEGNFNVLTSLNFRSLSFLERHRKPP